MQQVTAAWPQPLSLRPCNCPQAFFEKRPGISFCGNSQSRSCLLRLEKNNAQALFLPANRPPGTPSALPVWPPALPGLGFTLWCSRCPLLGRADTLPALDRKFGSPTCERSIANSGAQAMMSPSASFETQTEVRETPFTSRTGETLPPTSLLSCVTLAARPGNWDPADHRGFRLGHVQWLKRSDNPYASRREPVASQS